MANSTQILTDIQSAITTGPSAATTANFNAAAGPILDPVGTLYLLQTKFKESKVLLNAYVTSMDGSDPIKTTLQGILNDLV